MRIKYEISIVNVWIRKMLAANHFYGMVAPLTHVADLGIPIEKKMYCSIREEFIIIPSGVNTLSFNPLSCGSDSSR